MIRFLLFFILSTIITAIAFFSFKAVPATKKIALVGGVVSASAIAIWMQGNFAWYMSFLAILALSLVATLLYMKIIEREQIEKERLKAERQAFKNRVREESKQLEASKKQPQPAAEQITQTPKQAPIEKPEKVFGMESIGPVGKGN
ncbi:hypothetical protein [Planococcus dechangensis]|uniref:MFS transporter n=1 Tax=Planococcus dechangensis TaxID=1176255 RepID=A0ABV9MA48_9BACL